MRTAYVFNQGQRYRIECSRCRAILCQPSALFDKIQVEYFCRNCGVWESIIPKGEESEVGKQMLEFFTKKRKNGKW